MLEQHDIVAAPDYSHANPYQALLVAQLSPMFRHQFGSVADALTILQTNPPERHTVFHLHWEDYPFIACTATDAAWSIAEDFVREIESFVELGGSLVWTFHNERPHRDRFPEAVDEVRRCLATLVDVVVVHGVTAARIVRDKLGVQPAKIAVVPHGHYIDAYGFRAPGPFAHPIERGALGDGRVLLLFGRLDAYKGISRLADAFAGLSAPARLVIVGRAVEDALRPIANLPATVRERVFVREGFVPDEEVRGWFDIADIVVLPYEQVLTSGSLMLALSAGRPVVLPALESLEEIVRPNREAWFFRPGSTTSLASTLREAVCADAATLDRMAEAAWRTANAYGWETAGLMLSCLYAHLTATARARRRTA